MRKVLKNIYTQSKHHAYQNGVPTLFVVIDYLLSKIIHGFSGEDYFVNSNGYAMSNLQKRDFFTHQRWIKLRKVLNDKSASIILDDKVKTLKYFEPYVNHRFFYPKEHTFAEFEQFVSGCPRLLSKPLSEEGGKGINLYSSGTNLDAFKYLCDNELYLEELIEQHPEMNLNNASVNTVRVYSIVDAKGDVHILKAVLRAGIGNNLVDNFHSGGVIYPINVEKGLVESYGVCRKGNNEIVIHPGTDKIMLGFQIPHWHMLVETVINMAKKIPSIRYVGWDIVITPDGVDFIEANESADHALFSRIGNERLFYKKLKSMV